MNSEGGAILASDLRASKLSDGRRAQLETHQRLVWIDILKGIAIFAVLLHHFPTSAASFSLHLTNLGIIASIRHIWHLAHSLTTNSAEAAIGFVGAFGYQGVHVFLVASGFGLAVADRKRDRALSYGQFLKRRAGRLLPPYWTVVLILALIGLVQSRWRLLPAWVIGSSRYGFLINLMLLRDFRESWVWIFPGAFWFVPIIVELYLCYPVITWALRRFGARALIGCAIITLLYRALAAWGLEGGPVGTDGFRNNVPMMFFPARLFEFALGITLAQTGFLQQNERSAGRRATFLVIGIVLWAIGTTAASRKSGYFVSDPLIGAGLFFVVYEISRLLSVISLIGSAVAFLGRRSYSIYLVHSVLIPSPVAFRPGHSFFGHLALFSVLSLGLAVALDMLLIGATRLANVARQR